MDQPLVCHAGARKGFHVSTQNIMTDEQQNGNSYQRLADLLKQYLTLNVENARLKVSDKLSVLLSTIALLLITFALINIALLFFTVAVAHLLALVMPIVWAYAIMCGFNLLILLIIVLLRKPLIINPIT